MKAIYVVNCVFMDRRRFLSNTGRYSLGFLGLQAFVTACQSGGTPPQSAMSTTGLLHEGYGPLQTDPAGVLNLPPGFSYEIISRKGDMMSDGFLVPGSADGMATFAGPNGKVLIVRNHEVSPGDVAGGPFGEDLRLLSTLQPTQLYDYGRGA